MAQAWGPRGASLLGDEHEKPKTPASTAAIPASTIGAKLAVADPVWDARFTRQSGWTGGDVVGTVDLEDGRLLWMFGDTWIGRVERNAHIDAHLVNNTVAIEALPAPGSPRAERSPLDELTFYWGPRSITEPGKKSADENSADKKPQAWLKLPPENEDSTAESDWQWFTGGAVVARRSNGAPRLAMFLFRIGKSAAGAEGVWGFESRGVTLATVDDFSGPASDWRIEQRAVPFAIDARSARRDHSLHETSWGMAAFRETPDKDRPNDAFAYIYGVRSLSSLDRHLLLARARVNAIDDFSAWRFFAGPGHWSPRGEEAIAVAVNVPTELSVERVQIGDRAFFAMVHGEPPLGRGIMLRLANRPEGPWTAATLVYSVPEVDRDKRYFAYAAKGHAPHSPPGELLISYVVNAHDFGAMARDATIYRPRFVRAALKDLPLPPAR